MRFLPNPFDSENSLLPWHTRAYLLCDVTLDAAGTLLNKYNQSSPKPEIGTLLPCYFLFGHSIELFLKASLSFSSGSFKWTHEIGTLYSDFLEAYPSEEKNIPKNVHDFLRTYLALDPKNENYRYPHDFGVLLDPQDAEKILRDVRDYMQDFRKRIANA